MKISQVLFSRVAKSRGQKGVTMIEYALIAALIAIVSILALTTLGGDIAAKFGEISTSVTGAGN